MARRVSVRPNLKTTAKSACALLLVLALASCAGTTPSTPEWSGPHAAGDMAEPANREASGLAASRRTPGLFWTHNDSGGEPVLLALGADGARRGAVRVTGVTNFDWEDCAAFELDGKAWLVAADIGDNFATRAGCVLHFLEEPPADRLAADGELTMSPAYSTHFTYEDGPRDCESVAVDPREGVVYLLSKRNFPARLYTLPLRPAPAGQPAVARFVGVVPHLPQPTAAQQLLQTPTGVLRGMPCAIDFAPDGSAALVLTYGDLLVFPRAAGETWAAALAKVPLRLAPHNFAQAEGACFSRDGKSIHVCTEKSGAWVRYDRR
jgi:hypothetical protein